MTGCVVTKNECGRFVEGDPNGIEDALNLGVEGNNLQGGGEVFSEKISGFVEVIEIRMNRTHCQPNAP